MIEILIAAGLLAMIIFMASNYLSSSEVSYEKQLKSSLVTDMEFVSASIKKNVAMTEFGEFGTPGACGAGLRGKCVRGCTGGVAFSLGNICYDPPGGETAKYRNEASAINSRINAVCGTNICSGKRSANFRVIRNGKPRDVLAGGHAAKKKPAAVVLCGTNFNRRSFNATIVGAYASDQRNGEIVVMEKPIVIPFTNAIQGMRILE